MAYRAWVALLLAFSLMAPLALAERGQQTRGTILLGNEDVISCIQFSSCKERDGITLADVEIGTELDALEASMAAKGEEVAYYDIFLNDQGPNAWMTSWVVCMYEGDGTFITCDGNPTGDARPQSLVLKLKPGTEHLRLFPQGSAYINWVLEPRAHEA
ncbi:MAG: hypothetical protein R3185_04050 [Candidatus Thermoplasmatota archaeon]|nr:hypothetical protein [Candidatus Thermoplasmatota archaeon]